MKSNSNVWRLIYIGLIFLIQFGYGLNLSIIWSVLVDLGYIYNGATLLNTYLMVVTSMGYLVGSLSGWLYRWLNRQLVLVSCLFLTALAFSAMPFYGTVSLLFPMAALGMLGSGVMDTSSPSWLVELWPERSATLILISLFMLGLGTTTAPILVAPFVHGENNATANYTISVEERQLSLLVPFSVSGIMLAVPVLLMLIAYFVHPYREEDYVGVESENKSDDGTSSEPHHVTYRKTKVALLAVCVGAYCTFEVVYPFYYPTMLQYLQYSSPPVHFSATEAARLTAIMLGIATVSRLITSFVALKVTPDKLLVWHYLVTIAALALTYFGHTNKTLLYVGTIVVGYGFSAMWASILSFTERHIHLTPRINSIFSLTLGSFALIAPQTLGPFLKDHPLVLFLTAAIILFISLSCFIAASFLIYFTAKPSDTGSDPNKDKDSINPQSVYQSKIQERRKSIYQIKVDNRRASVLGLITPRH